MEDSGISTPTATRFGHIKQLDGLRGLSILLVLIGHVAEFSLHLNLPYVELGHLAGLGVLVFFVLSGFLISGLLLNEEDLTGRISLTKFYMRRVLRIMPAFYTMMAIVFLLICLHLVTDISWLSFAATAFYLRDLIGHGETLSHTWSLSLEEQFYLIWPFLLIRLKKENRLTCAFLFALTAPIIRALSLVSKTYVDWHYARPYYWWDCILAGCLIALIWTDHKEHLQKVAAKVPAYLVFLFMIAWTISAWTVPYLQPAFRTVQLIAAALILISLVGRGQSSFARLLRFAPLCWFGKVSYSIYLWQQIFIVTKLPDWGILRQFPIDTLAAVGAGALSYYFVEKPFLKLKHKWEAVKASQ